MQTEMTAFRTCAQFNGQGQGFLSRLQRACAADDTGALFEMQVSTLEELDSAATHTLRSTGGRLDGWCTPEHFSASLGLPAQSSAVGIYASQVANYLLFSRMFVRTRSFPSFECMFGHSQGTANAVLASATCGELAAILLSR